MMAFGRKKPLDSQDSHRLLKNDDKEAPPEQAPSLQDSAKVEPPPVEYQFGIDKRLNEAVPINSVSLEKRSPDLVPLSKEFEEMRKGLRQMICSAKKYQESMATMDNNRLQMVKEMTAFAEGSPLACRVANPDQSQSVLSVYQNASKEAETSNQKFQTEVIDYCTEWEAVVSTRVDKEMAVSKKLRDSYNHYLGKVDTMRKKFNAQEAKGKGVSESIAEKMQRNEEKLLEASREFEAMAGPLCALLEQVVHQGWRDLYPLIHKTMKWEADRSQSEARVFLLMQPGALEAVFRHATGTEKPRQPAPAASPEKSSPVSGKAPPGQLKPNIQMKKSSNSPVKKVHSIGVRKPKKESI